VAAESDPGTTIEALKAQAIAARSFYFASPARHHGYQFCDTTHCQFLRAPPKHTGAAAAAVAATRGQTLRYSNTPLAAMFSSSCGGQTRTLAEAGMIDDDGYPYYAVQCEACRKSAPEWRSSVPVKYSALLEDRSDAHRIELGRILGWSVLPGYNYKTDRAGDHILVHGRGSGHGIGLCQRGASAMAASGADYRTILRYYYANTVIGFVE
jgi:stage II sporulation protein D